MNAEQTSKTTRWPAGVIFVSSIPILLTILAIILAIVEEVTTTDGIYDVTMEGQAVIGGLFFAIPCGLINLIVGNYARSRDLVTKKVARTGAIIGVLGILIGFFVWVMFLMISSFQF